MRKFKNATLLKLASKTLERNKIFEGRHEGESCYIFGNGASLKYFDLEKFDDRVAIGCNALFFHRDFEKLNVSYYFSGHPFLYYPFWTNPYSRKFSKNLLGPAYRAKIETYTKTNYFLSLSNYPSLQGDNIYYVHHFDRPFEGYTNRSLHRYFTPMSGALQAMLGLAINLGFADITLVGCDYSFTPRGIGHYFEAGTNSDHYSEEPFCKEYILDAVRHAKIKTVVPNSNYSGHILPHISYMELTGDKPVYRENHQVLGRNDMVSLSQSEMKYRIYHEK